MTSIATVPVVFAILFLQFSYVPVWGVEYEFVGCFRDHPRSRALKHHKSYRGDIDWNNFPGDIIKNCASLVEEKGSTFFALQNWGECWWDDVGSNTYAKYGASTGCVAGVGKGWTNAVYKITRGGKCSAQDGRRFFIPPTAPFIDGKISCQNCKCNGGRASDCKTAHCDYAFKCEKYKPHVKKGDCCPECECFHKGKQYQEGGKWTMQNRDGCMECQCSFGRASCRMGGGCLRKCANPVMIPGKCCPYCEPSAPTVGPTMILTIRPQFPRPPLVLPPRPPGISKRTSKKTKDKRINY